MSLEQAIVDNTAAIHALIAALSNPSAAVPTGGTIAQAPVADNSASSTAEASSVAKPEAAAQPAKKKAADKPAAEATGFAPAAGSVTKPEAVEALKALAVAKGRDQVVAVLAQFKAAKLDDVKPKDYAALIAACEAV